MQSKELIHPQVRSSDLHKDIKNHIKKLETYLQNNTKKTSNTRCLFFSCLLCNALGCSVSAVLTLAVYLIFGKFSQEGNRRAELESKISSCKTQFGDNYIKWKNEINTVNNATCQQINGDLFKQYPYLRNGTLAKTLFCQQISNTNYQVTSNLDQYTDKYNEIQSNALTSFLWNSLITLTIFMIIAVLISICFTWGKTLEERRKQKDKYYTQTKNLENSFWENLTIDATENQTFVVDVLFIQRLEELSGIQAPKTVKGLINYLKILDERILRDEHKAITLFYLLKNKKGASIKIAASFDAPEQSHFPQDILNCLAASSLRNS